MPDNRNRTEAPPGRDDRPKTGVQRALDMMPDVKRHLRNADAHISRARRHRRTAA